MPFLYTEVEKLENTDKVGTGQCIALVQHFAKAPVVALWRDGGAVLGNLTLQKGTTIANFVNGSYENKSTGNHAGGIWIMDQWTNNATMPKVSKRYLRKKGKDLKGNWYDPSNNAEAFSVIK